MNNKLNISDMIGQKFGFLTVIGEQITNGGHTEISCQCDCGNIRFVAPYRLKTGHTKSCGKCDLAKKHRPQKGAEDISGKRFGSLVAIEEAGRDNFGRAKWLFRCDCGNTTIASANNVKNGTTKSCGCMKHEPSIRRYDLTGRKFGRLTVVEVDRVEKGCVFWKCQCDCGNSYVVKASYLLRGSVKSCGCLQKDITTKGTRANKWAYDNKRIFEERCAKCGGKSNLQSHHILPRNKYPELSQNYANGITLCYDCHKEFHHKYGFNCNIQDMVNFLGLGEYEVKIIDLIIHHKEKSGAEDIKKVIHYAEMILENVYGYKNGEPAIGLRLDTGTPVYASEVEINEDAPTTLYGKSELFKKGLTERQIKNLLNK